MTDEPEFADAGELLVQGPAPGEVRAVLAVPLSGPLGLNGPAALASARMAVREANARGIDGKRLRLVVVDAGRSPSAVAGAVRQLVESGLADAVCGFHTSATAHAIAAAVADRVPYVFTPPHEGGPYPPGTLTTGPGPQEQLSPVLRSFGADRRNARWAMVGNDYVWPRLFHRRASAMLGGLGLQVVLDRLVPFGYDKDALIDTLAAARADRILVTLVGRDLADFNARWSASAMATRATRFCFALDENALLEGGGDDTGELYSSLSWFAGAGVDDFAERYAADAGPAAPLAGAYARECFDGVLTLAEIARAGALGTRSARAGLHTVSLPRRPAPLLARAVGLDLRAVG